MGGGARLQPARAPRITCRRKPLLVHDLWTLRDAATPNGQNFSERGLPKKGGTAYSRAAAR
jgi:hypothetical protein